LGVTLISCGIAYYNLKNLAGRLAYDSLEIKSAYLIKYYPTRFFIWDWHFQGLEGHTDEESEFGNTLLRLMFMGRTALSRIAKARVHIRHRSTL